MAKPEIYKLKIVLNTNTEKVVDLTSKMFIFDKKTVSGNYPYVCTNINYDKSLLESKELYDIVETFFNKQKFEQYINRCLEKNKEVIVDYISREKNIMTMLDLMFPISFPISDAVERVSSPMDFGFGKMLRTIIKNNKYIYLTIDKPSTVIQVKWLDTLQSNPIYYKINKLNENYKTQFESKITDIKIKLMNEEKKKKEKVIETIKQKIKEGTITTDTRLDDLLNKIDDSQKKLKDYRKGVFVNKSKTTIPKKESSDEELAYDTLYSQVIRKIETLGQYSDKIEKIDTEIKHIDILSGIDVKDFCVELKDKIKMDGKKLKDDDDDDEINVPEIWQLYFLCSRYKKKSKEYYDFIQAYMKKFMENDLKRSERRGYYRTGSTPPVEYDETQMDKYFTTEMKKKIQFHYNYLEEIAKLSPPNRTSHNEEVSRVFDNNNELDVDYFTNIYETNILSVAMDKLEENGEIVYEIQLGIAIAGGKVSEINSKLWCGYYSNKLASDLKFNVENPISDKIRLYSYIDLENADKENNYNSILNVSVDKEMSKKIEEDKKKEEKEKKIGYDNGYNNNPYNNPYGYSYGGKYMYGNKKTIKRKKRHRKKSKTYRKKSNY
jgi:hypothetical protein